MTDLPEKPAEYKPSTQEFWRSVVDSELEHMKRSLIDALDQTKTGHFAFCEHCDRKVPVTIPDIRARSDAVKTLHTLGGEMPKTGTTGAQGSGFTLKRTLIMPTGQEVEIASQALLKDQ